MLWALSVDALQKCTIKRGLFNRPNLFELGRIFTENTTQTVAEIIV